MKKLLSLIIAAIIVASALASCTAKKTADAALNANIRLTSSDALDAAAWLDARLGGNIPDRLVIGTDASAYGVDVSALEDDGFFIRSFGREDVLFARTPDGLDRAVRRYAKMIESGSGVSDVTYHEGPRIEKLLLAGSDISTFAIRIETDNDYVREWVTDELAVYFAKLIGMATGFTPELGGTAEHYIILRHVVRDGWNESSYNYHFEDGDLVIEFVDLYGSKNGALMFLQDECGWVDLTLGYDVLEEADLIDIPANLNVTKHLLLPGGVDQSCLRNRYSSLRKVTGTLSDTTYMGCALTNRNYKIPSAHHALGTTWARAYGTGKTSHYVCLTSEYVFEDTVDEITAHIAARLDAGEKLGDDMAHIDLGMEDGNIAWGTTFCKCKDCYAVFVDEGGAWAGPMIRFANRVEEAVDEAGYDGIKYSVFAYVGTQMPPKKTAPNDDIYVTMVMHDACDKHILDGSQCWCNAGSIYMIRFNRDYNSGDTILNNVDWCEWIRGWRSLGTHLYIRMATLSSYLRPFMTMYTIYDNMKFFAENGVMSMYNETYAYDGIDFNLLVGELYQLCQFYPEMTREEYYAEFDRLLGKYYGDGSGAVRAICDLLRRAEILEGCMGAWSGSSPQYNDEFFLAHWDELLSLADSASRSAASRQEERFCDYVKCIVIKMGCASTYRVHGADSEEYAAAGERWGELVALFEKHGHPIVDASTITIYYHGVHEGNVILFSAAETGYWPAAIGIEPTLEAMGENIQY